MRKVCKSLGTPGVVVVVVAGIVRLPVPFTIFSWDNGTTGQNIENKGKRDVPFGCPVCCLTFILPGHAARAVVFSPSAASERAATGYSQHVSRRLNTYVTYAAIAVQHDGLLRCVTRQQPSI